MPLRSNLLDMIPLAWLATLANALVPRCLLRNEPYPHSIAGWVLLKEGTGNEKGPHLSYRAGRVPLRARVD